MTDEQGKAQQPQQPEQQQKSLGERFAQWVKDNHEQQPSLGAELKAMAREAVKDVRDTVNQAFFGQGDGQREPGAPLNPTMQEVTSDRELLGDYNQKLDQHAARGNVHGKERDQDKGMSR